MGTSASAGTISGATSVCAGSTITLNDPVTGGTWSSGSPLTASVSSTGTVSGLASGTAVISYTVSGSCGVAVATSTITVNPLPVAGTISGPSGICLGTPITLTDASGGGSWTSSLPGVATVNASGVVNGVSTGTTVITYTVSNTCGTVFTTHPVTVSLPPSSGTISGPSVVCQGATITLSDGVAGGTWSSSAGGTAAVGSFNGVVSGVSSGTASISYTITGSCGSAASVYSVTVNPPPTVAAIAGGTTICQGTTVNLTDATPSGVWSTPTPGIASVSSTGLVTGLSGGAATVDYSVSGACGTTTVTYTVNVTGIPDPASIVGLMGTCVGNTFTLFDATPGGTWTSSSPSTAAVSSGGVVSGLALGTATITYTVANTCGTAFVVHPVTVNVPPTVGPISGTISSFCAGTTTTLTDATSGGAWITGAPGVASVSSAGVVTGLTGGPATISYTVANTCASVSATYNVTIVPQPNAGSISGSAVLCTGSSSALTDAAAGGVFSSSQPAVATINASGIVTGLTTGTTVITYTVTNSCGSVYTIFPVAVSTPPVAGTIAGSTNVCVGATTTLTDTATGGTWSGSNAAVATVSAAGIVTGVAPGSIVVSYTVAGSCENLAATQTITVNPLPDAGVISGSSRVCIGTPSTLTETVSGGSWTSSSAPVASISAGGIVVGVTSGVVTISYTVTNSCGTAVATMTDTVVTASVCATGVEEMGANASFSVYPNPSNGVFNVELPVTAGKVTVLVTDLFGKVVATQQADGSNGKLQILLTDLAAGNYVIKITSGDDIFRSKITIW